MSPTYCIIVRNFFNYDKISPPPIPNVDCYYLTNDIKSVEQLQKLGWKVVYRETAQDIPITLKRVICRDVKCFPEKYIPNIHDYDYTLCMDASVIKLNPKISNFVFSCENYCLLLDATFYPKGSNNLMAEFSRSITQKRWSYQHEKFRCKRIEYSKSYNLSKIPVCSAKYIVINNKEKKKHPELFDFMLKEWEYFLQGNIILSIASNKYPNLVKLGNLPRPNKHARHLQSW